VVECCEGPLAVTIPCGVAAVLCLAVVGIDKRPLTLTNHLPHPTPTNKHTAHPQVSAAAAICNLVLDFRSIRQAVLQAGALRLLVPLAASMMPELRACAVRALTNLTIKCEDAATRQVGRWSPRSWGFRF